MALNFSIEMKITDTKPGVDIQALANDFNGSKTLVDFLLTFKEFHIVIANEVLRDEQSRGFDKKPRTRIDGKFDRPVESVKPLGVISFFAKMVVSEALVKVYEELIRRSPVDTGKYRNEHVVFFNKQLVARSLGELQAFIKMKESTEGFKLKDTIRFLNATPYARKLEFAGTKRTLGKVGINKSSPKTRQNKKGETLKKPNGTYYVTYRMVKSKYSSIARFIRFGFLPNHADGIDIHALAGERTTFVEDNRPYLYPFITIRLSDAGIKDAGVIYD